MRPRRSLAHLFTILALLFVLIMSPIDTRADVIADWNQEAVRLALLPASGLSSTGQTRPMAIVHVAIHDAVNGITRENRTYLPPSPAPAGASPEAAAIAAAHHALRNLFPNSAASLDAMFLSSLAANGLSPSDPGIAYGQWAAASILAARSGDGAASDGVNEVIDARVYSGIHFRNSDEVGADAGTEIAHYVWANALRPCQGGRRGCS